MLKYKAIAFILLTAVFISAKAYCDEGINNKQIITVNGTVTKIDSEGSAISVQTDKWVMDFHIPVDAELLRGTHHMASIEIEQGDPVTIRYFISSSGKNDIISLVDHKSEKY